MFHEAHASHAKGHPRRAGEVCSRAHQQAGDRSQRERSRGTAGGEAEESTTGELLSFWSYFNKDPFVNVSA